MIIFNLLLLLRMVILKLLLPVVTALLLLGIVDDVHEMVLGDWLQLLVRHIFLCRHNVLMLRVVGGDAAVNLRSGEIRVLRIRLEHL